VLDGADEQVVQERPVLERRLGERRAAAPAPDEVQDAVDRPEALPERCRPVPGGGLVEQVDRAGVQARHVEPSSATSGSSCSMPRSARASDAPAAASTRATLGPSPPPAPATA
jgi:hypothetical protein